MSKHNMPSYEKKPDPFRERTSEVYKEEQKTEPELKSQSEKCKVGNCESLNVRKGPSLDSPVSFVLHKDAILFAKETDKPEWAFVIDQVGQRTGYAMVAYLEEV